MQEVDGWPPAVRWSTNCVSTVGLKAAKEELIEVRAEFRRFKLEAVEVQVLTTVESELS